ncbi:unnamed protein product [Chironomus riparius]|uniref:Ras-related protein Rab-23 n=1 Tax=Chironomus riparius TaxID=315576 RepID=A0A9N9WNS2_9DIPT|nr:unnamed protein product [Chironomus riparius]
MIREEELEIAIKVVIVGNGGVGKSSMIQRYCKGIYTKDYKKTIGVDFLERMIDIDGEDVRIMLWDTAGQEEFDAITKAYYRGAQACVITFSTTDRNSFEAVKDWKKKVENECGEIPTVLVQNKIDLIEQSIVTFEETELLAKNLGVRLFQTSVKEDLNVSNVFRFLATKCHEIIKQQYNNVLSQNTPTISQFNPTFHSKNSGTIVLTRPLRKSKRKSMLKKCGWI